MDETPTEAPAPQVHPASARVQQEATALVLLALKSLSQSAFVALNRFLITGVIFSAWFLSFYVLQGDVTVNKLVGVGLYATFVLLALIVRRGKLLGE